MAREAIKGNATSHMRWTKARIIVFSLESLSGFPAGEATATLSVDGKRKKRALCQFIVRACD
ncbi:hypothetical protein PSSHI_38810 [Photobacterium sp. R1]